MGFIQFLLFLMTIPLLIILWTVLKYMFYVSVRNRILMLNKAGILTNVQARVYLNELENPYDSHAVGRVFEELKQYPLIINKER